MTDRESLTVKAHQRKRKFTV